MKKRTESEPNQNPDHKSEETQFHSTEYTYYALVNKAPIELSIVSVSNCNREIITNTDGFLQPNWTPSGDGRSSDHQIGVRHGLFW